MEINELYNRYKSHHIYHHNECRMCRTPSIESNLYEGYRECRACINSKWEGYFFKPIPPLTFQEWKQQINSQSQ